MPTVHNWQLGRSMRYPYEAASPKEQFAFVININRCIGCQTCTMACKSTWTFAKVKRLSNIHLRESRLHMAHNPVQ